MKKPLLLSAALILLSGFGAAPTVSSSTMPLSTQRLVQTPEAPAVREAVPSQEVQLLGAGTEPRQPLRFVPVQNARQTIRITMNSDLAMTIGGYAIPAIPTPSVEMTMDMAVTAVQPNGDIRMEFTYTDASVEAAEGVPPEVVESMRQQLQQLVGVGGFTVIDSRGRTKEASFSLPESLGAGFQQAFEQMLQSLDQLSSPFPEEAVGVGATWQVTKSLDLMGMTLNQVETYELVERQGDAVVLNVGFSQRADAQPWALPGLPPEATVNLNAFDALGSGQVSLALDRVMPIIATMSSNANMEWR
ncbi:MAG: hypothetical protein HC925_04180 [Coleofasciculaceae cyanobacterium SM2_3_26]|nr:hypothetical protein [Coleofasciculaceae cyanobacterium SM2_3_26]